MHERGVIFFFLFFLSFLYITFKFLFAPANDHWFVLLAIPRPLSHRFTGKIGCYATNAQFTINCSAASIIYTYCGRNEWHASFLLPSRTRAPEIGTFSANSSVIIHRVTISLSLSLYRQVTKTNDPFNLPKHEKTRAILTTLDISRRVFYVFFVRGHCLKKKKEKNKNSSRETINELSQEVSFWHEEIFLFRPQLFDYSDWALFEYFFHHFCTTWRECMYK